MIALEEKGHKLKMKNRKDKKKNIKIKLNIYRNNIQKNALKKKEYAVEKAWTFSFNEVFFYLFTF